MIDSSIDDKVKLIIDFDMCEDGENYLNEKNLDESIQQELIQIMKPKFQEKQ